MLTKPIKKDIQLNAPKQKVWDVLFNHEYTRQWYAEFALGAYAETDWSVGSKAKFLDANGDGMLGRVVINNHNEILSVEYEGLLEKGREVVDTDEAKAVKGGRETYVLTGTNGATHLHIEGDMSEEYFEMMSVAWDRALQKIKMLSEAN